MSNPPSVRSRLWRTLPRPTMRPPSDDVMASITASGPAGSAASIASPSSSANEIAPTAPCSRT